MCSRRTFFTKGPFWGAPTPLLLPPLIPTSTSMCALWSIESRDDAPPILSVFTAVSTCAVEAGNGAGGGNGVVSASGVGVESEIDFGEASGSGVLLATASGGDASATATCRNTWSHGHMSFVVGVFFLSLSLSCVAAAGRWRVVVRLIPDSVPVALAQR